MGEIMKGLKVGYIRVSTTSQNPDRQLEGVILDRVFTDMASGRDMQRPKLQEMLNYVREGDVVYVHSLDRFGRNIDEIKKKVDFLNSKGVVINFLKENLILCGNDSSMSKLIFSLMSTFAEFELSVIRERQREGIAIARKKGKYAKRLCMTPEQIIELKQMNEKNLKKTFMAKHFGISRESVYKYLS